MRTLVVAGVIASLIGLLPPAASAQRRPAEPTAGVVEIKLDETSRLKAAALEAQIAAITANFQLLQRQYQDLVEERKKLLEEVGKKANMEVKDTTEWVFDNRGQRYVKIKRSP